MQASHAKHTHTHMQRVNAFPLTINLTHLKVTAEGECYLQGWWNPFTNIVFHKYMFSDVLHTDAGHIKKEKLLSVILDGSFLPKLIFTSCELNKK